MEAYLQLIKSFVWSVLGFAYELITECDRGKSAIFQI